MSRVRHADRSCLNWSWSSMSREFMKNLLQTFFESIIGRNIVLGSKTKFLKPRKYEHTVLLNHDWLTDWLIFDFSPNPKKRRVSVMDKIIRRELVAEVGQYFLSIDLTSSWMPIDSKCISLEAFFSYLSVWYELLQWRWMTWHWGSESSVTPFLHLHH